MAKKKVDISKKKADARALRCEAYANKVGMMFSETVNSILSLHKSVPELKDGQMFSFDDESVNKQNQVTALLRRLHSNVVTAIRKDIGIEWDKANDEADRALTQMFGDEIRRNPAFAGWMERNHGALNAFASRSEKGLKLSDRIWRDVKQLREEMEVAMTVSIGEGESASSMSRKVRQYLNDPDLMFRRFRYKNGVDKDGNPVYGMKWKKRVKDEVTGKYRFIDYDKDSYKTGRGVYKSASKNAMRVTRTETNIAYRRADNKRWLNMDFVLGYRIKIAHNHPEKDICDTLQGDYPKDFVFDGWHPQCFCYCTPILIDEEEMVKMMKAKRDGKEYTPKGKEIKDVPANFKKWVEDNADKIDEMREKGTEPYFLRHNSDAVNEILKNNDSYFTTLSSDLSERLKPSEIKDVSEVKSVIGNVARNHPEYFKRGFKGVVGVSEDSKYMSTTIDGLIKVNFAEDSSGYNAGDCLVSAIGKIKRKTELSRNEEYAIESMWHEILHNKSANKTVLPSIKETEGGFTRATAETINQLLARQSYKDFLSEIGGKSMHEEWILRNGHAYNDSVSNLRALLKKAGINEKEFVKRAEIILMQDYTGIDKEIENLLTKMYRGKRDIAWAFRGIELEPVAYERLYLKIFD